MPRIHHLDNFTINQIAAGEVVERPSSVVKELVENAIDAGSTAITIEIEGGGTSYIRITDNGEGMDPEDALVSFERHATSKIAGPGDLNLIASLGFRGEALASITAVSQLEMITKTKDNLSGLHIINHGGEIKNIKETGCPDGTTILVRNLFFNTPARLKFLKSNRSETASISELMAKLIMAKPHISFKYINQGRIVYHSPGNSNLLSSMLTVYGRDVRNELTEIHKERENSSLSVHGFIGKPSLSRTNRNHQSFYINGRFIKSSLLSSCIEDAYKTQIMVNHFPWVVLHLEIPPSEIDVNAHPSKTEIRFKNEQYVYDTLLQWLNESLEKRYFISSRNDNKTGDNEPKEAVEAIGPIVSVSTIQESEDEIKQIAFPIENHSAIQESQSVYIKTDNNKEDKTVDKSSMRVENNDNTIEEFDEIPMRIVGSAFATYIIVEGHGSLYIIDQHAGHERLMYEHLKEIIEKQVVASQQLLPPYVLEVTHDEHVTITEHIKVFSSIGFELDDFGGHAFIVRGVPVILKEINVKEFFNEVLDSLKQNSINTKSDLVLEDIIKLACKKAVKANNKLADQEIISLIKGLNNKRFPLTCPHGRPILISMTRYELERKFKRIQ